jgi:uncharacterized protein
MPRTEIDRRRLLAGLIAGAGVGLLAAPSRGGTVPELYAATRKAPGGDFSAVIFDLAGRDVNAIGLPARGHDVTVCPVTRRCVAFARRPGNFAVAFAADRAAPPISFTTPPDRHFYGHGVFSPDGRLLFATENAFAEGQGRIGIYDATGGFKRLGEFSAYGIDPHDIALLSDGRTLAIANGGLATHPDFGGGRAPLDLTAMQPSLSYVDLRGGDLIETHALPADLRMTSLRHLDKGAGDRVVIGCQTPLMNEDGPELPLVLRHRLGEPLAPVELDGAARAMLNGYVSSVAIDAGGELAAVTSSKGNGMLFIDVVSGRVLGSRSLSDVSGVAPSAAPGAFLLTTGFGEVVNGVSVSGAAGAEKTPWQWDNHATKL